MIGLYLFILIVFPFAGADAGAPPSDVIPWDTVWVTDTVYSTGGEPVTVDIPILFITRLRYETDVLGNAAAQDLAELRRETAAIKALVKAKMQAKGKP